MYWLIHVQTAVHSCIDLLIIFAIAEKNLEIGRRKTSAGVITLLNPSSKFTPLREITMNNFHCFVFLVVLFGIFPPFVVFLASFRHYFSFIFLFYFKTLQRFAACILPASFVLVPCRCTVNWSIAVPCRCAVNWSILVPCRCAVNWSIVSPCRCAVSLVCSPALWYHRCENDGLFCWGSRAAQSSFV